MALSITPKIGETITIGDEITIELKRSPKSGQRMTMRIEAPKDMKIYRHQENAEDFEELARRLLSEAAHIFAVPDSMTSEKIKWCQEYEKHFVRNGAHE